MPDSQIQRIAELEGTVSSLERREKRLRSVISSAWISRENRRDAREELESLLNTTESAEQELFELQSPDEVEEKQASSTDQANCCGRPRAVLRRRFSLLGKKKIA